MVVAIRSIAEANQTSIDLVKKRDENTRNYTLRYLALEEAKVNARIMGRDTRIMALDSKAWYKRRKSDIRAKIMLASDSCGCYIPEFDPQQ
jgi:hypothetical protein